MLKLADNYRDIIQQHLNQRKQRNAGYSLRSFARDIGIAPSRLSEVLAGKAGLSPQKAAMIAKNLKLSKEQQQYFCDLVEAQHGRSSMKKDSAVLSSKKYRTKYRDGVIKAEQFTLISDWRHLAIMELLTISDKLQTGAALARRLGLSTDEMERYVERLIQANVIERKSGKLQVRNDRNSVAATPDNQTVRRFHDLILTKARGSLYSVERDKNEYSSTIVAIAPEKLERARSMIKNFWREFCEEMDGEQEKTQLYCLSMQFFDLLKE